MSKIEHILLVIHIYIHSIYGGCMFSVYPIPSWWLREYIALSYYHQIGSMNYYPLIRVRSWNNGMRRMSLYILLYISSLRCKLVFSLTPAVNYMTQFPVLIISRRDVLRHIHSTQGYILDCWPFFCILVCRSFVKLSFKTLPGYRQYSFSTNVCMLMRSFLGRTYNILLHQGAESI